MSDKEWKIVKKKQPGFMAILIIILKPESLNLYIFTRKEAVEITKRYVNNN